MTSAAGLCLGLLLGMTSTRALRQQTLALVLNPSDVRISRILHTWLLRFTTIGMIVLLLVLTSAVAALAFVLGYWFGRTVYLVRMP